MKVNLVVTHGIHAGEKIPIATTQFLIGRSLNCNLRPASPSISMQHCGIFVREGKVFVQDFGSTNGTCINGEQIGGECEIFNADKLNLGPLEFVIRIEMASAAPASRTPNIAIVSSKESAAAAAGDDQAAAMLIAMEDDRDFPTQEAQVPDGLTAVAISSLPAEAKQRTKPSIPANTSKAAADILSKYRRRPRK